MREIEDLSRLVSEDQSQRHQRINSAYGDPIEGQLNQLGKVGIQGLSLD